MTFVAVLLIGLAFGALAGFLLVALVYVGSR